MTQCLVLRGNVSYALAFGRRFARCNLTMKLAAYLLLWATCMAKPIAAQTFTVSPPALSFSFRAAGVFAPQDLTITNTSPVAIDVAVTVGTPSSPGMPSLSLSAQNLPLHLMPQQFAPVTVSPTHSGVAGIYTINLTFASSSSVSQVVPVQFSVLPRIPSAISISTPSLDFAGPQFTPDLAKSITIAETACISMTPDDYLALIASQCTCNFLHQNHQLRCGFG